ncbi:hypothetical protein [Flavobacterium cerinum]|uniref:Uncharacterized protein n=1 Tax=Flavobacterium cerinum TaxID=2502784 RepID=A0ABY5IRV6_9FLAO|nr:hypothetical protein [Flavobacterium cerinum]UUC45583.1 hypothetical protein NOX80_18425 [Flavobacterium cerinum]
MQITQTQKKYALIGFGVVVAGVAGYFFYNKVIKPAGDKGAAIDPTGNGTVTSPNVPTQTFNAARIADDLYRAMEGAGYASFLNPNERDQIFKALEPVKTEAQFKQVSDKFGRRSYNTLYGNQVNWNPFASLPLLPLRTWLETELEYEDYILLKKKYPNYL